MRVRRMQVLLHGCFSVCLFCVCVFFFCFFFFKFYSVSLSFEFGSHCSPGWPPFYCIVELLIFLTQPSGGITGRRQQNHRFGGRPRELSDPGSFRPYIRSQATGDILWSPLVKFPGAVTNEAGLRVQRRAE